MSEWIEGNTPEEDGYYWITWRDVDTGVVVSDIGYWYACDWFSGEKGDEFGRWVEVIAYQRIPEVAPYKKLENNA